VAIFQKDWAIFWVAVGRPVLANKNFVASVQVGELNWGPHYPREGDVFGGGALRVFSSIGLNGVFEFIRNRKVYSTHVSKVDNVSVQTIYQWKRCLLVSLKM